MKKIFEQKSKIIALLLSVAMTASMFAGCANSGNADVQKPNTDGTSQTAGTGEKRVLRVGIANPGREELVQGTGEYVDDCWSTKYIIDNFGTPNNIEIKFEIIDDTNGSSVQNYQLRMASKKAPDLFFTTSGNYSFVYNLAKSGALADLRPQLDQYGENVKKFLGQEFIDKYGVMLDKLYTIPGRESVPQISDTWIRADWLQALGLKAPTNFDEWYETLKAFKDRAGELQAAGLIKNAADVIPYGSFHMKYFTPWERIVTRFYPEKYFDTTKEEYYIYSGYGTEWMKEGFKEGFQFINKMYNEGLFSKNFAIDSDKKQFTRDIANGNVGCATEDSFFLGFLSDEQSTYSQLVKNIPNAKYDFNIPFTNAYDGKVRNPLYSAVMTYAFVPSYSENADLAMQYLNFVTDPDNAIKIQYGEEGVSYDMDPVSCETATRIPICSAAFGWLFRFLRTI